MLGGFVVHSTEADWRVVHRFLGPVNDPAQHPQTPDVILSRRPLLLLAGVISCLVLGCLPAPDASAQPRLPSPADWPLAGTHQVVEGFVAPAHRYGPGHRGVDLAARSGMRVVAAAAGVVAFAGSVAGRGVVSIDHGDWRTTYEPIAPQVTAGQSVGLGQPIGRVSRGGHCAARCLHWGLRYRSEYFDPLIMLGQSTGPLRLLAAAHREVAAQRARERADALTVAGPVAAALLGASGGHGFLHPVPGAITSAFGMRFHPVLRRWKLHDGTDFGAGCGTPIRAPYAGLVTGAYFNAGYGQRLIVDHGSVDGVGVETALNHATHFVVRPGQRVTRGQVVGFVGSTGYSTGCHLHLMVWLDGRLVDPMTWF
jgi:murein DD-endopeptidase MepM/ murein hydrolase activator NlpD